MKNLIKTILFFGLLFSVSCKKDEAQQIETELKAAADNMNKMAPQMISDGIRLDKAEADGNKILHYHYTLVDDEISAISPEEISEFKTLVKDEATKMVKTSEEMAFFRENGVVLKYSYHDKNGKLLFDFDISPKDYQ